MTCPNCARRFEPEGVWFVPTDAADGTYEEACGPVCAEGLYQRRGSSAASAADIRYHPHC